MPNRILKETIKSSPQIDSLSWFEEVLFYRLMVSADDYGCMDGRVVLLKNELFPLKDNVTKKAVEDAISRLVSAGLLCKYTVNGMPYLFFPTWEKHQRIRNKHRKYPDPTLDSNSLSNDGQMTADCQPESNPNRIQVESESESESEVETHARKRMHIPPDDSEAKAYYAEKGFTFGLDKWFAKYESNGWKVGREKMKDWKASMRYWQTLENERPQIMAQVAKPKTFAQMWSEMSDDET